MLNVTRIISCSILAAISIFTVVFSTICYAGRTTEGVTVPCAPSVVESPWITYNRGLDATLTLTTIGMYVKDLDRIVGKWTDDDEQHDYENAYDYAETYGAAIVSAQCVPPGGSPVLGAMAVTTDMYSYPQNQLPPILSCPKGYSIAIRYLRPFNPDPTKFVYHATLTVDRDDPVEIVNNTLSVKTGLSEQSRNVRFLAK